jgi:FkbM family methyltransferase
MQSDGAQIYYDQETAVDLLTGTLKRLENKIAIDVGADNGTFLWVLLKAGAEAIYAFEPYPGNLPALRSSFADTPAVRIFDLAIGARDGDVPLYVVEAKTGRHAATFHTLDTFDETPTLRITGEIPVSCRTLDSLVADGTLPAHVGILKVHATRSDFTVLQSMGRLSSAAVMIEFWDGLSETLGPAAYRVTDVVRFMAKRGYSNYVIIKCHDRFETAQVNCDKTRPGDRGNILFIHDEAFPQLSASIFEAVTEAQDRLADKAVFFAGEAERRLTIITDLQAIQDHEVDSVRERLQVLEEQEEALEAYLRIGHDDGIWKWVKPQLGVLYQHDPIPFYVPEHYLKIEPLPSPQVVSIVTPTMNSEQFLMHTINSIIDQSYPNMEYIIQDGSSSDGTLDLIDKYASKIAHVNSARDSGMAQAINRGFSHATGDIMAYLNSDDLLLPGSLNFVASYFARNPDVDVVYGHRVIISTNGEEVGRWVLPPHDSAVLSWADYVPQETLFWRRRIWEKIGAEMDETFRFALDWDLLLRFREAGARFVRVPRFLGAFRVHDEQKTARELADVGSSEMNRLRDQHVGKPVSAEDVWHYLRPYMRRHKVYHKLYRLGVLRY